MWLKPEVEREVKVGMDIDDARVAMNALGFNCELEENAKLRYRTSPSDITKTVKENVDFLRCSVVQHDGFISEAFVVSLLLDDESVEEIFYEHELSGL